MRTVGRPVIGAALSAGLLMLAGCDTQTTKSTTQSLGSKLAASASAAPVGAVVPWVDAAAPPLYEPTAPASPPPSTDAPACRADQIDGRYVQGGGAAGHWLFSITFINTSTRTCLLRGVPTVVATSAGLPNREAEPASGQPFGGTPGDLAPGASASVELSVGTACNATPPPEHAWYHRLSVTLPTGGKVPVDVTDAQHLGITCGFQVGRFGVEVPEVQYLPVPWANLAATLSLPATATPGATMDYVVNLTNPTDQPVSLHPCPGYLQAADPAGVAALLDTGTASAEQQTYPTANSAVNATSAVKQRFGLNCSTIAGIPARSTVAYAMRLPVPAEMPPGTMNVRWTLLGTGMTLVSGTVRIP